MRQLARQSSWLFGLALFGYPIIGNIISVLDIDSRTLSIPFRMAVILFSLWLIATTRGATLDRLRTVMVIIWFMYVLRLLHDWLSTNLEGADYALQFFIAASVLPSVAIMRARAYERRRFALIGFLTASAGTLASLLAVLYGDAGASDPALATGRLALAAIDSVSLGHLATSAILCGAVMWRGAKVRAKLLLLCTFPPLLWCLILTGSKGPSLALMICVGLWALRRGQALRFGLLVVPLMVWVLVSNDNPLMERVSDAGDDQSTVDRVVIFNDSVKQIVGSPWVGSAFVELNSGYYPHDVFVEAGLAFGIPIALVFLGMMVVGTYRAWKTLNSEYDLLGLLFIQGLFGAAISGAIFGSTMLWVTLAMLPQASALKSRIAQSTVMRLSPAV